MALSQRARDDFRNAYRKAFEKELTDDEADEIGERLLRLFRLLLRPLPGDPPPEFSTEPR